MSKFIVKLILVSLLSLWSVCMHACSKSGNEVHTVESPGNSTVKELSLHSRYVETINNYNLVKNIVNDYNAVPNSNSDQSEFFQSAIDDISAKGGGKLFIPAGSFYLANVYMKSNVHILVDSKAVLKLAWGNTKKNSSCMFLFSTEEEDGSYIENCSIRGINGSYTVDYSFLEPGNKSGVRFIICRLVKNFLIADAVIKDNYTKFCGIIFVPASETGADKWEISRPTNGEIRNCSIFNADSGYGLCQLHGAQSLYFRKLYAKGGVTLRLESGAGGEYAGVYDIQAKNIQNENGRASVMMNPHTTHNGTVKIDSVWSKSSSVCLLIHKGFIDRKHQDDPNATIGSYADDSKINNVHAIFGTDAQVDSKEVYVLEPDPAMYKLFRNNNHGNNKSFDGPSLAAVFSTVGDEWEVTLTNITSEGFKGKAAGIVTQEDVKDREAQRWSIVNALPNVDHSATRSRSKSRKKR